MIFYEITFTVCQKCFLHDKQSSQECIPVVAHGRIVDGVFESNRIEVKHSNQYVEKNTGRINESDKEAAACSVSEG